MRIALLGVDDVIWPLAEAVFASDQYTIACAYDTGELADRWRQLGVDVRPAGDWELLLHDPDCDVVAVGRGGSAPQRAERLRRLVQAAIPLVVAHPIADMLLGFELQMIQQDTLSVIVPFFVGCQHPLWAELHAWTRDPQRSPVGKVEQFEWERSLADRSQANVATAFAQDSYLQRRISDPILRLGALLPGQDSATVMQGDWSQLSAHMDSADGALIRWTVKPTTAGVSSLRILGTNGQATAQLPNDPDGWQLSLMNGDSVVLPRWQGPLSVLDAVQAAQQDGNQEQDEAFECACRAVELAETLEVSCRRGRTIDLHQEELSEEGTFKSLMAAGGCLALLLTLGVTFLAALLSPLSPKYGREGPSDQLIDVPWLWLLLLAGLMCFLMLQLLRLLFPRPSDAKQGRSTS